MGAPVINISFIDKARTIFERAERGIVGLILRDTPLPDGDTFRVQLPEDIPAALSNFNKKQIKNAIIGNVTAPKYVECYVIDESLADAELDAAYAEAMNWVRSKKVHFIAIPTVLKYNKLSDVISNVKSIYDNDKKKIMAILPFHSSENHEAIVGCEFECDANMDEETYTETEGHYTAEEFCSRIAGFIAGTPFTQSITYGTLPEIVNCNTLTVAEQDEAVNAGKLILMNDGEKIKIVRGVNTLVTTTAIKKESFKKIKIVNIMNLIYDDLTVEIRDQYIGKYNNTYDDKVVLATAVNQYFKNIAMQSIISDGYCEIDFTAQRAWLMSVGEDVTSMSEEEVLKADTGSIVFLTGKVGIPDAIEDIEFPIYL